MIKVALLIGSLIAFSAAATLFASADTCLYQDQLWGSADGTKYYFCDTSTNTAIEQPCPPETFFVKNSTTSGCLPFADVDPSCISSVTTAPDCTGDALKQPQPAADPTEYYVCPEGATTPIKLQCQDGFAFMNQDGYLGCFQWDQWRTVRNCPAPIS